MKNIFEKPIAEELIQRIHTVEKNTEAKWGKMNASQMLSHCADGILMAKGKVNPKRVPIGYIIGKLIKKSYYSEKPYPKSLPTAKELVADDGKDFETEKKRLIHEINLFSEAGAKKCTQAPHPMFGKLKPIEWSMGTYKHIHHHLSQFGK